MLAVLPRCSSQDAGECRALENAAAQTFETFVNQYSSCSSDTDCTLVHFTESSFCASPCPQLMNQTGAASAIAAASQDCTEFNALGCTPPYAGCIASGSPICAAGTCALYELELTYSGSFTHGVCAAMTETYLQSLAPTAAPRDFSLTVTATNGTLYADGSCTTALSSSAITLPKGSTAVTFGFIPAAGYFSVSIDGGSGNGGGVSGQAQ